MQTPGTKRQKRGPYRQGNKISRQTQHNRVKSMAVFDSNNESTSEFEGQSKAEGSGTESETFSTPIDVPKQDSYTTGYM